jgi:hypothetical protein
VESGQTSGTNRKGRKPTCNKSHALIVAERKNTRG